MHAPQYREMAAAYDWPQAVDFSRIMFRRTQRAFRRHGIEPPARVCDLACGTGTLALLLADAGYRVTGVDVSPAMLRRARAKSRQAHRKPAWRRADMRDFTLPRPVHAVTCYYDSMNHLLTRRAVHAACRAVHRALTPGGVFCFDANTRYCFDEFWGGLAHQFEHEGTVQFIEGTFSPRSGRASATVTGFVPAGRRRYRKFVERVDERYYSGPAWRDALRRAGFTRVRLVPFDPWAHGGPKRIKWFVTAQKPAVDGK